MTTESNNDNFPYLEVHRDKSIFFKREGQSEEFQEGRTTLSARERAIRIQQALDSGYLRDLIEECRNPDTDLGAISEEAQGFIESLVEAVTSEVGRAVVGLAVMQLCIKSICPEQNIRLHKGSRGQGSFSWKEGISMRTIDRNYVTPLLREYELSLHNRDGVMMTRTLAENYPYTQLFKANVRGARDEWLHIVDLVEENRLDPLSGLKHLLVLLHNKSTALTRKADSALHAVEDLLSHPITANEIVLFIKRVVDTSTYSARLFEIALHSLFQVLEDRRVLPGFLKPMSQMRSANKKHGDIGDVQVIRSQRGLDILESWDAKYGKPYLRDEIEELHDKLEAHPEVEVAGFVTDTEPDLRADILERKAEIAAIHDISLEIQGFDTWVDTQLDRIANLNETAHQEWLIAFAESICQRRRERAPIDEPCDAWITELDQATRLELTRFRA